MKIESFPQLMSAATRAKLKCPDLSGTYCAPEDGDRRLMVIGEAPTEADEEARGTFHGDNGSVLRAAFNSTLAPAGFYGSPYLTYALKFRPAAAVRGNRPIKPEELAAFKESLMAEIAFIQPRVILALGGTVAKLLSGRDDLKVSNYINATVRLRLKDDSTYTTVITWHPQFVLNKGGIGSSTFYHFVAGIKEAAQIAATLSVKKKTA